MTARLPSGKCVPATNFIPRPAVDSKIPYLCPMLRLYRKSVEEPLTSAELLKVEEMRKQYPWFALPSFILAKNRLQSGVKGEIVQAAAALAPNRAMLKEYLTGVVETLPDWQDESPEIVLNDQLNEIDSTHSEPIAEPPVVLVKDEAPVAPEPVVELAPEPSPEPIVETAPVAPEVEPVAEPIPQAVVAEVKPPPVAKTAAPPPSPGIDWGLNTRIEIRSKQYLKWVPKLEAQIAKYKAAFVEPDLVKTTLVSPVAAPPVVETAPHAEPELPPSSIEAPQVPVLEAAPEVLLLDAGDESPVEALVIAEPVEAPQPEMPVLEEVAPPTVQEIETPPEPEVQPLSPLEKTQKLLDSLAGMEKRTQELPEVSWEQESVVDAPFVFDEIEELEPEPKAEEMPAAEENKEAVYEAEYKIGAFSGFAFLGSAEPAAEEEKEAPEAEAPETGAEIVLNEEADGRIVEITVSEEQLKKYFKGKLPSSAVPPPAPEKKTTTPRRNPEVKDFKVRQPVVPAASLDRREYVSSLIEKFIENEPSIGSVKAHKVSGENLARPSLEEDDSLVTETLAAIHLKQGNAPKAIKIYQKLALQFPEKKDYFVALISKIKGL